MSSEDFNPSRAIVMSEVHTRDKEKYYNLLHGNSVQTKLTSLKKKYLLIFLNSQIKIQR